MAEALKSLSVLTIGNSFTDSLASYFQPVVESAGCELYFERANHGGCELHRHWNYIENEERDRVFRMYQNYTHTMKEILQSRPWDIATMQQASHASWRPETFEPFGTNIYNYVRTNAPSAEICIQQTWSYRKDDPRTAYLVNLILQAQKERRLSNAQPTEIQVDEASLLPIKLQDYNGIAHDLEQVANDNRVVLLNFTAYAAPFSPALNKVINDLYAAHHAAGFEVFQVSIDDDNVLWRQAAQNLPWVTVYDPAGVDSRNVSAYAVEALPTSFVIVGGDIVARVDDATELESTLRRYL